MKIRDLLRLLLAVVLVAAGLAVPEVTWAQTECTECVEDVIFGTILHEVVENPTVLLGSGDDVHDWIQGDCASHLHYNFYPCNNEFSEPELRVISTAHTGDTLPLIRLMEQFPGVVTYNAERNQLQIVGCDGESVVAQFRAPSGFRDSPVRRADQQDE